MDESKDKKKKDQTNDKESINIKDKIKEGYVVREKDKNANKSKPNLNNNSNITEKNIANEAKKVKNQTLADEMKEAVQNQKNEEEKQNNDDFRLFTRDKTEKRYTIWILDEWLHDNLSDWGDLITYLIEVLLVSLVLIIPVIPWLIKERKNIKILSYFNTPGPLKNDTESLFRIILFTITWYTFDVILLLICENFISIMSPILYTLQLNESEFAWCLVDIFYSSRAYFRLSAVSFFIFRLITYMFTPYSKPKSLDITDPMVIRTLILWFGIYMGMLFVMKFLINNFIYDIKRSSYKETIWDLNHKIFVYKKLKLISETGNTADRDEIYETMVPSYDPGFYLKDQVFFRSADDAEIVAQNIMVLMNKKEFRYDDIKKYFPQDHEIVFKYLSGASNSENNDTIKSATFKECARDLYNKRKDMSRTLKDRDYIFDKLEVIFFLIVSYLAAIVLCMLFDIDYNTYLIGFGTSILTFSWVFADAIKKLFNCFVFVLVLRPYVIGDRVKINDEEYVVIKIDLLTTTFLNNIKTTTYLPNDALMNTKIYNIARSPPQSMILEVMVDEATTISQAKKLEEIVRNEVAKISKYFINAEMTEKMSDKIYYKIDTTQNFQSLDSLKMKKDDLIDIFDKGLARAGISHKNSFVFRLC